MCSVIDVPTFTDTMPTTRLRPAESQTDGNVVIVAVDQRSLDAVDKQFHYGWPWPRELLGHILTYLDKAGAKAVAFDMLFPKTSTYQHANRRR